MDRFLGSIIVIVVSLASNTLADIYTVDDSGGVGRKFDGIGGLSGGGATSKLLVNYPEKERNQILDYLFKPNFGASLQILKVEIGGDAQSTEGTESSHMHNEWDENYSRGYEWWLMTEAKKRNPNIKLYGLPWAFPGWLGKGSGNPFKYPDITATYIRKWVQAAKSVYNLTIDYVGIWNEHNYDVNYIVTLRKHLDAANLQHVQIIAPDGGWGISGDVSKNSTLKNSLYALGAHYPGTDSTKDAKDTGLQLWSSEDYSTFNDNTGAGCWARILNQNFVNGQMTSTISWNLIAAYYSKLPFDRCGLMTAKEPWSGHFVVESPIWITAHTTQFTEIGWSYLQIGTGSWKLTSGGSYVSLTSPDKKQLTMVIETMSHDHSLCIRPRLPAYDVKKQDAIFQLKGNYSKLTSMHVWMTKLGFDGTETTLMKKLSDVPIKDGQLTLTLDADTVYTLSTVSTAMKGSYPVPPPSKELTLPYEDNFDKYTEYAEVSNFVPQIGSFEVRKSADTSHGMINRQTVLETPIYWCGRNQATDKPITLGGNYNWSAVEVSVDVYIPSVNGTNGAFLALRVTEGGCSTNEAQGIFLWMFPGNSTYKLTTDFKGQNIVNSGKTSISRDRWFTITFKALSNKVTLLFDDQNTVVELSEQSTSSGFIAYGTSNYGLADFDNLKVQPASPMLSEKKWLKLLVKEIENEVIKNQLL